jgi:two-component system, NarL family, nitrate/nitrite response regulator NarL
MGRRRTFGPSGRTTAAAESWGQHNQEHNQDKYDRRRGSSPPRIYITSETRLFREGLNAVLACENRVDIVGYGSCSDTLEEIGRLTPELVLLDIAGDDSLALPGSLRAILPGLRVVAVAVSELGADVIACAEAGICGYVPRNGNVEHLIGTITRALSGELLCPPQITAMLFDRVATLYSSRSPSPSGERLTRREREIAGLIARGLQNKEIARCLCLGNATVKNHVHNILRKLNILRRNEIFGQRFDIDPWHGDTGPSERLRKSA